MKKPYQIENRKRAVKRLEEMSNRRRQSDGADAGCCPAAEMIGWLRKGVGKN